ncbi:type VI secretion protein [Alsobacter metallidurans]|uniref:Type VI secretion protein n=1 Tax=Alsobacter metallidurans TaxID=340221 RepID=A0A917I8M1_9HYPH|nr:type VI secretion system baseplate subunit TssE [Alsobacter metallidurans]GGH20252.1 type VI secretion protein [Alsobacter metallidurans]
MSQSLNPSERRSAAPRPRLPLLARLCEAEGGASDAAFVSSFEALEALRTAVRRDVEALLNARRRRRPLPSHLRELPSSILNYGIPDPVSGAYSIPGLRDELVREVERTLQRFEPRLTDVTVALSQDRDDTSNLLRMRVTAVLRADPIPEPVAFETRLETVSRDIVVREA